MALPKVTINIQNGQLGAVTAQDDGITGLIIGADVGASGIVAGQVYELTSIDDAIEAGFDDIAFAYRQISEFYDEAPDGSKLYVMIIPDTVTMESACDKNAGTPYAKNLLDAANGEIRLTGVCRLPDVTYTPTVTKGLDDDVIAAVVKAQALAVDKAAAYTPTLFVIEGRLFQGVTANLENLRAASYNRCAVVICSTEAAVTGDVHDGSASVGLLLGRLAAIPVQRNPGRVKSGALVCTQGYIYDNSVATKKYKTVENADIAGIHDKGYVTIRTYAGRTGYYFSDDPTATIGTDDYKSITNRRVIDKALRIVYDTYVDELLDEIKVDAEGKLAPGVVKSLQAKIENAIDVLMTANQEISSFSAYVDPDQNVLSTSKITVVCTIVPVGYSKEIVISLGLTNPSV